MNWKIQSRYRRRMETILKGSDGNTNQYKRNRCKEEEAPLLPILSHPSRTCCRQCVGISSTRNLHRQLYHTSCISTEVVTKKKWILYILSNIFFSASFTFIITIITLITILFITRLLKYILFDTILIVVLLNILTNR